MATTVVGTFDSQADARQAAEALREHGFAPNQVEVRSTAGAAEPAEQGRSWWDWLFGESEDRDYYRDNLSRGGALLAVTTDEAGADRVRRLLQAEGADDVEATQRPPRFGAEESAHQGHAAERGEERLPVVEERVRVGKRPVARGGVRIYSHTVERPVEEEIRLREERVNVERRPVDRPVSDLRADAFRDNVIEMTETAEEVVVAKEARVVEEVVVSKDVGERVETVRETARRSEVEVEPIRAEAARGRGWEALQEEDCRSHWSSTGRSRGVSYEECDPAYRFGTELGADTQYAGRDWAALESDARRRWEAQHPGTWDRFAESIRYAWDRTAIRNRAA